MHHDQYNIFTCFMPIYMFGKSLKFFRYIQLHRSLGPLRYHTLVWCASCEVHSTVFVKQPQSLLTRLVLAGEVSSRFLTYSLVQLGAVPHSLTTILHHPLYAIHCLFEKLLLYCSDVIQSSFAFQHEMFNIFHPLFVLQILYTDFFVTIQYKTIQHFLFQLRSLKGQ